METRDTDSATTTAEIRAILKQHGRLTVPIEELSDEGDLYQSGLTSHASVNLMLALEDRFDVEFPERMLRRRAFGSIQSIRAAIQELTAGAG